MDPMILSNAVARVKYLHHLSEGERTRLKSVLKGEALEKRMSSMFDAILSKAVQESPLKTIDDRHKLRHILIEKFPKVVADVIEETPVTT